MYPDGTRLRCYHMRHKASGDDYLVNAEQADRPEFALSIFQAIDELPAVLGVATAEGATRLVEAVEAVEVKPAPEARALLISNAIIEDAPAS